MSDSSIEQKKKENNVILHKLPPLTTKKPIQNIPINSPIRTRNAFQKIILSPITTREENEMSTFENSKLKATINNNLSNFQKFNSNEIKIKKFNSPIKTKKPLNLNSDRFAPKISTISVKGTESI